MTTIHSDVPFPPKLHMNILEQSSTNYCINGMMGQDSLFLAINIEELESDWNLFKQRHSAPEPLNHNSPSKLNQQSTKVTQSDSSMAPKMRDNLNDAAKSKARVAVEAKKNVSDDEKKMSYLQQWINRIRKAKLDKHNWPKNWAKLREWGKSEGTQNFTIAIIKSYLNAPIIDNFGNLKEEIAKFLDSRYHEGKIWLDKPITIIGKLINFITDLPLNEEPVCVSSKNPSFLESLTGSTQKGKNSKGLQINSKEALSVKWISLIISIFLTISG